MLTFKQPRRFQLDLTVPIRHDRRGGAVIIMVVSLMTTLVVIGLFFHSVTNMELTSAEYFSATEPLEIDPDPIFETVLRQTIVGPNPSETQSALWGGHYSMVSSILGRPALDTSNDRLYFQPHAYNGRGATITLNDADSDGHPDLDRDLNGDSSNDVTTQFTIEYGLGTTRNEQNFIVNMSPSANVDPMDSTKTIPAPVASEFNPNAGYTYPDINSLFLAVDDEIFTEQNAGPFRLVIPSYYRPQLFTLRRFDGDTGFEDIFENSNSVNQVLRPHSFHRAITSGGDIVGRRFTDSTTTAQSGDRNRIIEAFPFRINVDSATSDNELGLFTTQDITDLDYDLDGDVDRDGIRDSIRLDLGHPMIELPNGRQVVPLAMIKWIDNDGLLNVNAHGNMLSLRERGRIINEDSFSHSNLGMSSYEVNLGLGLTADPNSSRDLDTSSSDIANIRSRVFRQHRGHFGFNPTNQLHASNMELAMLLTGRYEVESEGGGRMNNTLPILGRYGDSGLVNTFQQWASRIHPSTGQEEIRSRYTPTGPMDPMGAAPDFSGFGIPRPGNAGTDDDADEVVEFAKFLHPLDYLGRGNATTNLSPGSEAPIRRTEVVNGALVPSYDGRWMESLNDFSPNPITGSLPDEPDETMVEPGLRTGSDFLFPTAETFALHGSDYDHLETRLESRLHELAPFNFKHSLNAHSIRKRFTTDSWDRLEFAHRPELANRAWEFNQWMNGTSAYEPTLKTPANQTAGNTIDFEFAFPPQFGDPSLDSDISVFGPIDPYRVFLRRLLTSRVVTSPSTNNIPLWNELRDNGIVGQRLNINRLLTGFNTAGSPRYRRLTEHMSAAAATPGSDVNAQYDRQLLCRDIYVLMYTLCGAENVDYATTSTTSGAGFSPEQMEQMAQFAVNLVDALDHDKVITRFEYDIDLSNGWDLDDDPFTDTEPGSERAIVHGVEVQSLAINEVLFVHCEDAGSNQQTTEWNDSGDRSFCYIELQNPSPHELQIDEDWQVLLETEDSGGVVRRREAIIIADTVAAGDRYTIGSAGDDHNMDGTDPRPSYMRINTMPSMGGSLETLVPSGGALDLDLITSGETTADPTKNYRLVNNSSVDTMENTTLGDFFPPAVSGDLADNGGRIRVILRRRMNDLRSTPALGNASENDDNPWIEVDRVEIEVTAGASITGFANFDASATAFTMELGELESIERRQALDKLSEDNSTGNGNSGDTNNTLGEENSIQVATPTLWQPHFDRDFYSVAELLSVPLYGPDKLTSRLADKPGVNTASAKLSGYYWDEDISTAGAQPGVAGVLFMNPDAAALAVPPEIWPNGNRWYRLLEFLTVQNQNIERLAASSAFEVPEVRRTPGRINLNTLRHEQVLAGLLDDVILNRFSNFPTTNIGFDNTRQWFRELLRAREPRDHFLFFGPSGAEVRLPGVPGSKPVISNSYYGQLGFNSVKSYTAFRQHAPDILQPIPGTAYAGGETNPYADLDLFESRSRADVGVDDVDYHTRHRLLAKVLNNSTNRSHVYSGWIEIVFHEAHVISSGGNEAVQLGAEADDLPRYRMFCVVDMSRLEEAFDPTTGTFDFQKFIIHRQQLP